MGHRRPGAGPGPGVPQDEDEKDDFQCDSQAVEIHPGPAELAHRVESGEGDLYRGGNQVGDATGPGGQDCRQDDHQDRDRQERQRRDGPGLGDVESPDGARQDVSDHSGLVERENVHVDVQEHEAGPRCSELESDRDALLVQGGGGVMCSHDGLRCGGVDR